MNTSGILGLIAVLLFVAVTIVMGSPLIIFLSTLDIILVVVIPLALQWATLGEKNFLEFFRAFRVLLISVPPGSLKDEQIMMMRLFARHVYAAGAIGTFISTVQFLGWHDHTGEAGPWMDLAPHSLFYAVLFAECVVRPCATRIEWLLKVPMDK